MAFSPDSPDIIFKRPDIPPHFLSEAVQICQDISSKKKGDNDNAALPQAPLLPLPHVDFLHNMAIRVDFLLFFAFTFKCWEKTTAEVVRDIIIPLTLATQRSFAGLSWFIDTTYFGPADVFMSHCWGSTFGDLIAAASHGARSDRYVWIDIFAVPPSINNNIDVDVRGVVTKCKALILSISTIKELTHFMGNLDDHAAFLSTPAGRAAKQTLPIFQPQCLREIVSSKKVIVKGGRILTKDNGNTFLYDMKGAAEMMWNLSYMVNVNDHSDTDKITKESSSEHVNVVRDILVRAVQSINNNVLEIDAYMCGEKESFRELIINVGSTGQERFLAMKVLRAAGSGGHTEIVQELLTRWGMESDQETETETETKTETETETEKQKQKETWVRNIIDASKVIWNASSGGHAKTVELLLNVRNVNININIYQSGSTALCIAADNGHLNVVDILLTREDIQVNSATVDDDCTPLYIASQLGRTEIVLILLSMQGIDVNKAHNNGNTPLTQASQNGHADVVQLLLSHSTAAENMKIDVNKTQKDDATPLFVACQRARFEVVRLLLSCTEIDVNLAMPNGATPLIIGCYLGNVFCVKQLLSHEGIDLTLLFQGKNAFYWCQIDSRADGWEFLETKIDVGGRMKILECFEER